MGNRRTGLTTTLARLLVAGLAIGTGTAADAAAHPPEAARASVALAPAPAVPSPVQVQQARFLREVVPLVAPYDMGVAIRDNRTGVWLSYRGDRRVFLASTTKLATSAATFLHANERRRGPTPIERAWMVRALQVSDNNAQSALSRGIGSHAGFARLTRRFGLRQTTPFYGYGSTVE
ncbi:hypothetical protein [Arsenicicoccus dermatophilus]|uniref:hypothetical protein n=1 Tax=Arsenicicoccus dermatophilus TaxID=1076331 RepID=UPI001F4D214A|nr:hypothetical protein [Arsenicicoccus dermatophilus]MCH8611788.1 hypothetical protein [Arsenicicoccus dermatophilus]